MNSTKASLKKLKLLIQHTINGRTKKNPRKKPEEVKKRSQEIAKKLENLTPEIKQRKLAVNAKIMFSNFSLFYKG
ncbi:MAG: hypothetical protein SW833_19870 [Cyanobacteriota bacterium]|nr:hypothetical protein [Cyanobacteriota bacterium]